MTSDPTGKTANTTLPPRVADLGMSDDAVRKGTGKSWDEWVALLDYWGASDRTHTEIARYLSEHFEISGWWAQGVTVGYERARGKRRLHQKPDGFEASASRTFPVPIAHLYAAIVEESQRDRWLPAGTLTLRTAQENRSARFDHTGTNQTIALWFQTKGDAKSSVQLQHSKLSGAEDVERVKSTWKAHFDRLAGYLADE